MTTCPTCHTPVRPGNAECEFCGAPLAAPGPAQKRETAIGDVYVPPKRKTVVADDDPSAASSSSGGAQDASDPFARAVVPGREVPGRGAPAPKAATEVWDPDEDSRGARDDRAPAPAGAGFDPSDPFRRAVAVPGAAPQRRLAGVLVTFSLDPIGQIHPLREGRTVIGRAGDPGIDVEIAEARVSSPHCQIIARGSGVLLRDGGSTNGTWHARGPDGELRDILNEMITLQDGDRIRVGGAVFLVHLFDRALVARIWPTG